MVIRFSDIGEALPVKSDIKGKYQTYYGTIYNYAADNYDCRKSFKILVTEFLNIMLYFLMADGDIPFDWDIDEPDDGTPDIPDDVLKRTLKQLFLTYEDINWDLEVPVKEEKPQPISASEVEEETEEEIKNSDKLEVVNRRSYIEQPLPLETDEPEESKTNENPTPKEDLFITNPKYPRLKGLDDKYPTIYTSLPEIPRRQSEISSTTKIERVSDSDLLNLFPNRFIQTRAPIMYQPFEDLTLDPDYGL